MTVDDVRRQLQLPGVGQIGVVVEDLDRAIAFYESAFGLGPFDIREVGAPNVWDRGQEKQIKARLAFATIGQVELELIQILGATASTSGSCASTGRAFTTWASLLGISRPSWNRLKPWGSKCCRRTRSTRPTPTWIPASLAESYSS